ncbi:ImmA/IrrE family metallo-endopeptidase [Lactobacillus intestinalis]|uniref:ImmA/IrrE family metallo-endopeptidase n=2 Tax=Lactobacillus intestinalis TaxID=151781 RepID=UPI002430D43E|nr:ImmA/IrrE family metallo-endopeptidase [Lactobacillus intestinalis]
MMTSEDRERFDNLIAWLINYCFDHQIGVVYNKFLPPTAKSKSYNYPSDLVVVNGNWYPETEIPFIFAHEIGHTIENTPIFNRLAYLGRQKGEYSANVFAINLLAQYCFENDIWFNSIFDFAKAFGIPHDKWYILVDLQEIN